MLKSIQLSILFVALLCNAKSSAASEDAAQPTRVVGFSRTLNKTRTANGDLTATYENAAQNSIYVNAKETLVGNTKSNVIPVTLVQRVGTRFWVVQEQPRLLQDGQFETAVLFPADQPGEVSKFRIVVLSVPQGHRLSTEEKGTRVNELPRDIVVSPIYGVLRPAVHISYSAVERSETRLQ